MLSELVGAKRKATYRRKGNQCRDARDWVGAAKAYRQHVDLNPSDQPIWVQLGHALKEQGLLEEAADAYQQAVDLAIDDGDANLHLADLLRRLGRGEEALAAYERVNRASPNLESAQKARLLRRDPKATTAVELGDGTVFFAIQDLFGYLKAHVTMSGIQRVQAGIALHAIRDAATDARFILSNIGDGEFALPPGEFWMVDNAQMLRVIEYASGDQVNHDTLRAMLIACEDSAERVQPVQGATIILLGAFWGLGDTVQRFVRFKRAGVRLGAYVYDIIPVTHPEFCDDALVTDFSMSICELCAIADFILTISDATQDALKAFIVENGGREIPMMTVPLAHHLTREVDDAPVWPKQLRRVEGKRYVAYISTIEGRKNHLYVVNAWRRLMAEGVDVPELVFVGRHGWKIGALKDVLTATDNLQGKLHIAHNLSDAELNAVYAGADFTVFTSFVEGWGLPIGESLFHGRPCVASNTSSIPEVGGEFVDYVDPFNLTNGVDVFRRMITDRGYVRSRANAIRDHFKPRTWGDVGSDFLAKVKLLQDSPISRFKAMLEPGQTFSFKVSRGGRINISRYFRQLNRLFAESADFYGAENFGVWMRGKTPELSVPTVMKAETQVMVYIKLVAAPHAMDCQFRIVDQTTDTETALVEMRDVLHHGSVVRMKATVGADEAIHLRFEVVGPYTVPDGDGRDFAIGLRAMAYADPENLLARQELTEAMMFFDLAN